MPTDQTVTHRPACMKAARVHQFGAIDAIHVEEIQRPEPAAGQVLVRVHAAGVGPWDAWVRAGRSKLGQPLPLTLGSDISGTVETVAEGVDDLFAGDAVYGATNALFIGAYAEFAVAEAAMLAHKPRQLSHVEAASVPVVACTAWQLVHTYGRVHRTERVLVHGAAGNVGAYAVQFAKLAGAHVIGTCRHADVAFLESLGVDQVVDVDAERFEDVAKDVDAVLDTVGGDTLERSLDVVRRGGVVASSVSALNPARSASKGIRSEFFYVSVETTTLTRTAGLLDAGNIKPNVGEVLPLSQARLAHEMLEGKSHKRGKIVLAIPS
jgi:NADPH:quinone reductase-like Zn-dependent oxidoreductase